MKRILALGACAAACIMGVASAATEPAAVGDLRVLVIRATWGPTPENAATLALAESFYARSSFGKLRLHVELTPWLLVYDALTCPADQDAAKREAREAGFDVSSYGRIAVVLPDEEACAFRGVVRENNEILLAAPDALVHELGHTFGLDHATSYTCGRRGCKIIDEYGDPLSPMGHGTLDFSAFEKLKLGWISSVQRVDRSHTYAVANIDAPSTSPQALVVPTAAGEYWIERRASGLIVRIVKKGRTIFLAQPRAGYTVRKVFSVKRTFAFTWLDRRRPSTPRPRALDHAFLSWQASTDAGSGVASYRVTLDGKLIATTTTTGTPLPALRDGGHRVTVVAVDRAGNRSRPGIVSLNV